MNNKNFEEKLLCNHCFFLDACRRDGLTLESEEEVCEDFYGVGTETVGEIPLEQFGRKMKDRSDTIALLNEVGYWE